MNLISNFPEIKTASIGDWVEGCHTYFIAGGNKSHCNSLENQSDQNNNTKFCSKGGKT